MDYNGTMNTMGTVLRRAHDDGASVEILVEGHWLSGTVGDVDAHGMVLDDHGDQTVIRLESVAAVHLIAAAEAVVPPQREPGQVEAALAG